jgi:D-alanyl-lipoteichoic acid acyltransferase DltB (MBOAT superfamily)
VTLLQAWQAAVGFTVQIYFDFSAYSDMACGAALLFGVRLPMNFDSPLKASNIIDFWARWHITLTRFLTAYVYNPVALAVTRRRAAAGKPLLRGRASDFAAYMQVLVAPTVFTMLISGIWHGAGYTFVIWGLIHGVYLAVNHAWRQYGPRANELAGGSGSLRFALFGGGVTFVAVAIAMVFFRAPDMHTAINIVQGMAGLNGVSLPNRLSSLIGLPQLPTMMLNGGMVYGWAWGLDVASLLALLAIAFFMPNTLQVLAAHNPTLQLPARPSKIPALGWEVRWRLTPFWTAAVAVLAAVAIWRLQGESEFLYWQF